LFPVLVISHPKL